VDAGGYFLRVTLEELVETNNLALKELALMILQKEDGVKLDNDGDIKSRLEFFALLIIDDNRL
jgi:hypothetical protein